MMKRKGATVFVCFFFVNIIFFDITHAAVKGSETAVSVEPAYTFPSIDTDNTLLGFGWFKYGFTLEDSLTTATFNGVFPVSGDVDLRGGTLYLLQDLTFSNTASLEGLGTIIGNNHMVQLCESIIAFPTDDQLYQDTHLFLGNNLTLNSTATFRGVGCLNGLGYDLTLDTNGKIVVDSNSTLWLKNIRIRGLSGTKIQCVDDTAQLILKDVDYRISDNYQFLFGSMEFWDNVSFIGTGTFIYASNQTSTVFSNSELAIQDGLHLQIGRGPISGNNPLAFEDATATFKLDNCRVNVTALGAQLTKGTVSLNRNIIFDMASSTTSTGIILGDGVSSTNDFTIYFAPSAVMDFVNGMFMYNNVNPNSIQSTSNAARLVRTLGSKTYVAQNLTFPEITVQQRSSLIPPIQVAAGKFVSFQNSRIQLPDNTQFDLSTTQLNPATFSLSGNQYIFLTRGTLPFILSVSSTSNTVQGNGNLMGAIALSNSSAQLICNLNGYVLADVTMGGGTLTLSSDLLLGNNVHLLGTGTVQLASHNIELGLSDLSWTGTTLWDATSGGGSVNLHSKVALSGTWTFTGSATIKGHSNTLDLGQVGNIVVQSGSSLTIQDMQLTGMSGTNVRCVDNTGQIILDNVTWDQSTNNYLFGMGALQVRNQVAMIGVATFAYQSTQTSTILANSQLTLDSGFTFSYDPAASTNLLAFIDSSSILMLNGSNVHVGAVGMDLTKGTMIVEAHSTLYSETVDNGITLGADDSTQDFTVNILSDIHLSLLNGSINYRNISSDSWQMATPTSFLEMADFTTLNLYETLDLGTGQIIFGDQTTLGRASGTDLIGSIVPLGQLFMVSL